MEWSLLAHSGLLIWLVILLLPWRPWSTRESFDSHETAQSPLPDITVLIPARNEQAVIAETLQGLAAQDRLLRIIMIDDQSEDETAAIARRQDLPNLLIISGQPLPAGWSGKLWALEQGLQHVQTPLVLLLDADIKLKPGTLAALKHKLEQSNLDMVSLMAQLRMQDFREKLLLPAFVFFFKLLYPFHLSNSASRWTAAAAGGCILVKTSMLQEIKAFDCVRGNLIDDCALARRIKNNGGRTWLGLTHSAISLRPYSTPGEIRDMVARTAFTQLHYSWLLLLACSAVMIMAFILPVLSMASGDMQLAVPGLITLLVMCACYRPVIRYYALNPLWLPTLPLAGILFLGMTWISAWRHAIKHGSTWKNRDYSINALK